MNSQIAIRLTNLSKKYALYHEKPTLAENIFRFRRKEELWALKDINLEIKRGEKIGIIGNNGSGKTTLLKIISGITLPTKGTIETKGKIATLIDVEAGFEPDLTGRENIFLNGLLLGMSKQEIKKQLENIIEFSGIEKFIDSSIHTYSTGMALRLGFSVAVHSNPDILLIDEVIAVGDQDFRQKCIQKMEEFFKAKKTIILVSHRYDFLKKLCQKIYLFEKGAIIKSGSPQAVIPFYQKTL